MVNEVARHYDLLVDEGNDPVLDPPELAAYMDGWDGPAYLAALQLNGTQDVLEIGVGTGRLAVRTARLCQTFTGIDISEKSIGRAHAHLADVPGVQLLRADFMDWGTDARFDVVYSSLTFMHLADKQAAAQKVAWLLKPGGRAVISLSRDASGAIDYGTRRLTVYPDVPEALAAYLQEAGLTLRPALETEFAVILIAEKEEG